MNAGIQKLLSLSAQKLVISPSISVLTQVNQLADDHGRIGPVPSALLCSKILSSKNSNEPLHPVHQKAINALSLNIVRTVHIFPIAIAMKTFSSFAMAGHPFARRILSSLQDSWFENWNPASLENSFKRTKLKQPFVGNYDPRRESRAQMLFLNNLRTLCVEDLTEALKGIESLRKRSVPLEDLKRITKELEKELCRQQKLPKK